MEGHLKMDDNFQDHKKITTVLLKMEYNSENIKKYKRQSL